MASIRPSTESPRLLSGPLPDNLALAAIPASDPAPKEPASMLLLERHTFLSTREVLTRTVRRLHTPQGVQDQSRVELGFDPAKEEITLHHLHVLRDGEIRASVGPEAFRLLQREAQLEAHIQDGRLSAVAHLKDVRPCDSIDIAFTTRNIAPAFEGKFFFGFALGWPFPIAEAILTVTLPADSPIAIRNTGLGSESRREQQPDGSARLVWHLRNPKPVPPDPSLPSWHIPTPFVQASDFADWNEVATHTHRLWGPALRDAGTSAPFRELVAELKAAHATPEAFAQAAIHFVQDQIRYLGLEDGIRSYLPEQPDKVLARRYGDCKDKTLLLCALLRAGGVTAFPVLVNSTLQHSIAGFLPSPAAFDHVIACLRLDQRYAWVDPTLPAQGGSLESRVLPRFVQGLIVHPKSKGLVKLPKPTPESGELIVQENYTVDYRNKSARLAVTTTARGTEADALRQALARVGHEVAATEFLRLMREVHAGAERDGSLELEDDREANVLVLRERYLVPEFIALHRRSEQEIVRLPGHVIARRLAVTADTRREHPLHLPFPNRVVHLITANLPEGLVLEKTRDTLDGPGFAFSTAMRPQHGGIEVRNTYAATANRVEPADLPFYTSKLKRVAEVLNVAFPLPRHVAPKKTRAFLGVAAALAIVATVGLLVKVSLGGGGRPPAGFDPLDDEPSTLSVLAEPSDGEVDEAAAFDEKLKSGIKSVLTDPGAVDLGGPSLMDAREFDLSLDPAAAQERTPDRIEGLPSLLK